MSKFIVIASHPEDVTLRCGETIFRYNYEKKDL